MQSRVFHRKYTDAAAPRLADRGEPWRRGGTLGVARPEVERRQRRGEARGVPSGVNPIRLDFNSEFMVESEKLLSPWPSDENLVCVYVRESARLLPPHPPCPTRPSRVLHSRAAIALRSLGGPASRSRTQSIHTADREPERLIYLR